ncbi:carbohydrate ABC transporter permease [Allofournierella sp.]|uniref:carbohydrate ABC transporter permease n=1 Tax=Allofournierella sp. TaxID=1940256 RepID=UPI003AB134D7
MKKSGGFTKSRAVAALPSVLTVLLALLYLFPFALAVLTAMKDPMQSARNVLAWPDPIQWDNFKEAIRVSKLSTAIGNSLITTTCSVVFITLFSAMGGYVIARNRHKWLFRFSEKLYLAALMVPFQVIMVPIYKMFKTMHLMNTLAGAILILVGTSIPYATFLYVGFVKSVPRELEEAAQTDGCGPFRAFFQIVLPLLKPITAVVAALHVLWMWNEFNISLIVLQKEAVRTVPIQQYFFFGQYSSNFNLGFAAAVVSMLPIVAFFLLAQRYLVEGIAAGAIKG